MRTEYELHVRCFPTVIEERETGAQRCDYIVLDKSQLQAAQLVGQSSKELIHRLYGRQGYNVLEIGTPTKRTIGLNLEELYKYHQMSKGATDGK